MLTANWTFSQVSLAGVHADCLLFRQTDLAGSFCNMDKHFAATQYYDHPRTPMLVARLNLAETKHHDLSSLQP